MINELVVKKVKLLKMIDCHSNQVTALSNNVNVNKNCDEGFVGKQNQSLQSFDFFGCQ